MTCWEIKVLESEQLLKINSLNNLGFNNGLYNFLSVIEFLASDKTGYNKSNIDIM